MADHPGLERVLHVHSVHIGGEKVSDLCSALPETHDTIIKESTSVAVRGVGVAESCGKRKESQ